MGAQALVTAASTGGVTDLKTTVALITQDAKTAFAAARGTAQKFRAAGAKKWPARLARAATVGFAQVPGNAGLSRRDLSPARC
jgi:hypothetical protein